MAESNNPKEMSESENDSLDINELASLNEDYSADFLDQLQNQLSESAGLKPSPPVNMNTNDTELFEDKPSGRHGLAFNNDIEDNFIKKYKAKLLKQQNAAQNTTEEPVHEAPKQGIEESSVEMPHLNTQSNENPQVEMPHLNSQPDVDELPINNNKTVNEQPDAEEFKNEARTTEPDNNPEQTIEEVSGGNIVEKPINEAQKEYKDSLNYIDGNTKYSKYVIYIDPENKDFIDSLTVKERKNLINRIIREQDSVVVTKKNLNKMQAIITHLIIAILTVSISIPCIYWVINASLESTINNYKTSQSMFKTLYKEHGKIQSSKMK